MLPDEQIVSGEKQLKEFSKFLHHHRSTLDNIIVKSAIIHNSSTERDGERETTSSSSENATVPPDSMIATRIPRLPLGSSIGINYSSDVECVSMMDLIKSDNKCLNKTIAVFVQFCMEVRHLCREGNPLLIKCLFTDEELCDLLSREQDEDFFPQNKAEKIDGVPLSAAIINKISESLEMLFQTQQFIERCSVVISEIIKQFLALFATENSYINVDHSSLHFQTVFNHLAEATILIIKFDSIFENSQIKNIWPKYMNAIRLAEKNIDKLSERGGSRKYSHEDGSGLDNVFFKIDYLLSGNLFQYIPNKSVQFQSYLRNVQSLVQKYVNSQAGNSSTNGLSALVTASANASQTNGEISNDALLTAIDEMVLDPSKLILKLNAMCILYHHIFGNLDQKLFSVVIENNTKMPCIILVENVIWSPEQFLKKFGSTLLMKIRGANEKMSSANVLRIQQQWLQSKCQRLPKDTQMYTMQVAMWILKVRNEFNDLSEKKDQSSSSSDLNKSKMNDLNNKTLLILQGADFLEKLSSAINVVTNLHVHIKCPMTKQSILCICKLVELLKMVKHTMQEHSTEIFNTTLCLSQYQLYQALHIIANVKKKFLSNISGSSVYDERVVDILSALELAQTALIGSPNIKRILVARLALTLADPKQVFPSEQLTKICRLFVSIEHFIQFNDVVHTLTSASYMYWHHEAILPIYLRHVIDTNEAADCEKIHVKYLFETVSDCHSDLLDQKCINLKCSEKLAKDVASILNEFIVAKLCGHIETKLRLDVHTNLQLLPVENIDPFDPNATGQAKHLPMGDLCRIVALKPIPVLDSRGPDPRVDRYLSVRNHVNSSFFEISESGGQSAYNWPTFGVLTGSLGMVLAIVFCVIFLPTIVFFRLETAPPKRWFIC